MSKEIEEARNHLYEICKDKNKFRMCIPVHKNDSDEIFGRAFDKADELEEENKKLKQNVPIQDNEGFSWNGFAKAILSGKIKTKDVKRYCWNLEVQLKLKKNKEKK